MRMRLFILFICCCFACTGTAMGQDLKVKKNDVKVTLLSLASGSTRITYERAFSPLNSAELTLGLISWGWDIMNHADPEGLLMKFAFKWNLIPQKESGSWLAGFYVKPELVVADYDYLPEQKSATIHHTTRWALMAECGYQWVLRWFDFDIYTGLGYSQGDDNYHNYYHSFMLYPKESCLAATAGFRVGVAF